MATRVNRKTATNTSPKEIVSTEKSANKNENLTETKTSKSGKRTTSINKRIAKRDPKKKTSLALKLKAKVKKASRINAAATKNVLQKAKTVENRKKILNNGVKEVKPRKKKLQVKQDKDESPPVLEPIFPIEENVDKKQTKKKVTKKVVTRNIPEIKMELDEELSLSSDVTDISNQEIPKQTKKPRVTRKAKVEPDTLEDIMNDLTYLIKDEVKPEVDSMSESGKSDSTITKSKKLMKRQRVDTLKKKIIKKENIENTLSKLDSADEKVIDMLDLNVHKVKRKTNMTKRRHSIEKFPLSTENSESLTIFNNLPRSISPKVKSNVKLMNRRISPYSTRSDSPRILRNGKQRKLKDINLLEGLNVEIRRRRRLCSDISEISGSKLSGYESDSSFSDMASSHGTENTDDSKIFEDDVKPPLLIKSTASNGPINLGNVDTNSNVCEEIKVDVKNKPVNIVALECEPLKSKPLENDLLAGIDPDTKVPEKSLLLDIMKQAFNEIGEDKLTSNNLGIDTNKEIQAIATTKFYEKSSNLTYNDKKPLIQIEEAPLPVQETGLTIEETPMPFEKTSIPIEDTHMPTEEISLAVEEIQQPVHETLLPVEETSVLAKEVGNQTDEGNINLTEPVEDFSMIENISINSVDKPTELVQKIVQEDKLLTALEINNIIEETDNAYNTEGEDHPISPIENIEDLIENIHTESPTEKEPVMHIDSRVNVEIEESVNNNQEKNIIEEKLEHSEECALSEAVNDVDIMESTIEADETVMESHEAVNVQETAEELAKKENILKALGLQSLRTVSKEQLKPESFNEKPSSTYNVKSDSSYTGTLKTVIKLNRDKRKGGKKIAAHKYRGKTNDEEVREMEEIPKEHYKIVKEVPSATWKQSAPSSDTAGARKSHYSNRSNMDGSSEHTSDGETAPSTSQDGAIKALVIPEKASSFSIHPGRLCKDECSYCFGKFGLFDTPCHIAQMKSVERQDKILATEVQLTRDSCLCDACYRHVDRKSNTPSYMNKSIKRNSLVAPGPRQNHCHVLGCNNVSSNILRRKWIIKMRKSICQVINIDLDNPGLHSIPICDEHYSALEHLMLCAMCKRRLARNHIHYLGPETAELNSALNAEGIPLSLSDKPVVCKLCKCFASIILKSEDEMSENSASFFKEYKKRLLHFNDIIPMDEAAAEEPITVPGKVDKQDFIKKKRKLVKNPISESYSNADDESSGDINNTEKTQESQPESRSGSPSDEYNGVDYNTLIPAIAMDCGSDSDSKKDSFKKFPIKDSMELVNGPNQKQTKVNDLAVQKLGSNPSISVRQLFPGEEDLPLNTQIDFHNIKDRTPEGWEKCSSIIQFDMETKRLWQELQKPYGNQSSFLRHLILLEKYFRNGDLVLSPGASHHSINYSESVHNRLRAYDNIPSSAGNIQPISMLPFNKMHKSSSGIITSATLGTSVPTSTPSVMASSHPSIPITKPPPTINPAISVTAMAKASPITLSQLNSPPLIPPPVRAKVTPAPPPGLISLHPGTTRPIAPLMKVPQPQKIKFPITKNWRPNLIPIDPTKKMERKAGLVQVISGGKPYHITLEDYKKMCAIKRSFEMKQKRLQEAQHPKPILVTHNSILKSIVPRKGLVISKTANPPQTKTEPPLPPNEVTNGDGENILEKLDKQVEKLESRLNDKPSTMILPKIPKSLTVIPQTVARKASRPSSPVLLITSKKS